MGSNTQMHRCYVRDGEECVPGELLCASSLFLYLSVKVGVLGCQFGDAPPRCLSPSTPVPPPLSQENRIQLLLVSLSPAKVATLGLEVSGTPFRSIV